MASENLEVNEVADRSGLSRGMIATFRRGTPTDAQIARGQGSIAPALDSMAALAHGLGLQLSYVLSKAGLTDAGDRWANFTPAEREALSTALYAERKHQPGSRGREARGLPRLASTSADMDDLLKVITPTKTGDE